MDIHLRDLRYFVAVAEEGTFTAAAARLHVSQPAVSRQVHRLETLLRAALLERGARGVRPTPAGAALLEAAGPLLAAWAEAEQMVRRHTAESARILRVGLQTGLGRGLYPAVSARFAALLPGWQVALQPQHWHDPTVGLGSREVDVAFAWLPLPEGLAHCPILVEPRWVVLPARHPLAASSVVAFADLIDEPFIAMPPDAGAARDYWLALEERGGRPPRIGAEAAGADATFEAVAAGAGIHLLAAGNADLYAREGVTCRPVTGVTPATLAVAWRADDERRATRAFVQACAEARRG
jgi:DNA-binding transcriptional LysR family regulator